MAAKCITFIIQDVNTRGSFNLVTSINIGMQGPTGFDQSHMQFNVSLNSNLYEFFPSDPVCLYLTLESVK